MSSLRMRLPVAIRGIGNILMISILSASISMLGADTDQMSIRDNEGARQGWAQC
jgi:hypothetical protein